MAGEQIIVAIELGSSKLTGVAGKRLADGSWQVEAAVQEPSQTFVHNGVIFNRDRCVVSIQNIVNSLAKHLNRQITQVYVGSGGQGLHTEKCKIERSFDDNIKIPLDVVNEMMQENLNAPLDGLEIVKAVPQEYRMGSKKQLDPIGVLTNQIEATYCNVVARPVLSTYVNDCFREAGVQIAELRCTPLQLGQEVLSDDERRAGCVLVDFGADTTTVAVYKGGLLRYLSVIPIGSAHITRDLMSLQIDDREAERIKQDYGFTGDSISEEEKQETVLQVGDDDAITRGTLCNVVEARLEEILVNVKEQISQSGTAQQVLSSGAVLVGGGAQLKNMVGAFKKIVGINKVSIRNQRQGVKFSKTPLNKQYAQNAPALLGAICVLASGTLSCAGAELPQQAEVNMFEPPTTVQEEHKETPEESGKKENDGVAKPPKKRNVLGRFGDWLNRATTVIVGDDDEKDGGDV